MPDGGGDAVAELWREYKEHETPDASERLIRHHAPLTLSEIGDVLGVTESRGCQIHMKAVLQPLARLADAEDDRVQ